MPQWHSATAVRPLELPVQLGGESPMEIHFPRFGCGWRVALAFASALAILVVADLGTYRMTRGFIALSEGRHRAQSVLEQTQALLTALVDAETGQRGYLITGDFNYLEPYNTALPRVAEASRQLRTLIQDDPLQRQRLDAAESLIQTKIAEMQKAIDVRRERGFESAQRIVLTSAGKGTMDSIRAALDAMLAREEALAAQRYEEGERKARRTTRALLAANFFGCVLLVGVFLLLNREITARRLAEHHVTTLNQDLSHRAAELTSAYRDLESFSYSVSHDLRAPVRHIIGFANLVIKRADKVPPEVCGDLRAIRDAGQNMDKIIGALLSLAQAGAQQVTMKSVEMRSLVEAARRDLEAEVQGRRIEWRIGTLPSVKCDPDLIKQALANLLSNAVKYTRPRELAVIEVGAAPSEGKVAIFVKDNGVGFDGRFSQKVFEVFERLHPASAFEGSGIGLATVQRIIERHGGRVWAESESGQGATFYFTLGSEDLPALAYGRGTGQPRIAFGGQTV